MFRPEVVEKVRKVLVLIGYEERVELYEDGEEPGGIFSKGESTVIVDGFGDSYELSI